MTAEKFAHWIVALALLALPVVAWFALAAQTNTHDLTIWLPSGTPERAVYDEFVDEFGSDENLLISWAGCSIEAADLAELKSRLLAEDSTQGLFSQVTTSGDALRGLKQSHPASSPESLKRQLRGVFLGSDLKTAGLVVRLSDSGKLDRKRAVTAVEHVITQIPSIADKPAHIAGAPYVNVQIDRATNRSLLYAIPGGLLSVLACLVCLRSVRLTAITLFVSGYAALASIAIVAMCGYQLNGMLIVTPVLVLVLSLSSGVHLSNYYRIAGQTASHAAAVAETIRHGWLPTTIAIITTVLGFLTLCVSELAAVRQFSLFSSASLIIALAMMLVLFPALLLIWPSRWDWTTRLHDDLVHRVAGFASRVVGARPRWARRASTAIVAASIALGAAGAWGLPRIQTDLAPERLFASGHDVSKNYRWLGTNFIPLNSVELVVKLPNSRVLPWHEQIELVRRVHRNVAALPFVQSSYSVAQLVPRIRLASSARSTIQTSLFDSGFHRAKDELTAERWLAESEDQCAWRIWVGVRADLHQPCDQWLPLLMKAAHPDSDGSTVAASTSSNVEPQIAPTGMWLLSTIGRERLFRELTSSFVTAFALITPLVILMLRSFWAGLVAMIPNVLPAVVFFGGLGWMGSNVDISTILTASVGMGIAVDSTVHFLQWYRAQLGRGAARIPAVVDSIQNCSRAMFYTTLISCVGLIAFAWSSFLPARQFALAIVAMLILALICDLFLTPALILSPIGFVYDRRRATD